MITKITGKNIKGMEFEQQIEKLNFICGPNGAGKSAITDALILALNGQVPGQGKANQFIFDCYAGDESGKGKIITGFELDKKVFTREFVRSDKGAVSQKYKIDGAKAKKNDWISAVARSGAPNIFDLPAFMALSDQKKIDMIFEIFPPAGDVEGLSSKIDKKRERLNSLREDHRNCEKLINKMFWSKAEIDLPAGTLAETSAEIERLTLKMEGAAHELMEIEKAEAAEEIRREEQEKAAREAEETAKAAEKAALITKQNGVKTIETPFFPDLDGPAGDSGSSEPPGSPLFAGTNQRHAKNGDPRESIKRIIQAIESVGCPLCANGAGIMVAKKELKKYL